MIDIVKTLRLINITSTLDAADEIERLRGLLREARVGSVFRAHRRGAGNAMTDLVARLRESADKWLNETESRYEAADEIERLTRENDFLRARAGNDDKECVYCGLGARDQGKCQRGFPGCARADDQQLCSEAFVCMERDELRDENERLRQLLSEVRPALGEGDLADRIDAALGVADRIHEP